MCVCGVCVCLHLAVYFPQLGGEKGSEISTLKKEFRMLGTLRSDICVILAKCDEMYPLRMLAMPAQVCVCV